MIPRPRLFLCAAGLACAACEPVDVPASALRVSVRVSPRTISKSSSDSARVTIRVRVQNPRLWPVRVDVGARTRWGYGGPRRSSGLGWGWEIRPAAPGEPEGPGGGTWGRRYIEFPPLSHGTHEVVLRINESSGPSSPRPDDDVREDLPPGRYHVVGGFGTHETEPVELTITP